MQYSINKFQSTPPARGATFIPHPATWIRAVSTQAPARGATRRRRPSRRPRGVSTHAPARRATREQRRRWPASPRFNPRPRTRSDVSRVGSYQRPFSFQPTPLDEHPPPRGDASLDHFLQTHPGGHGVAVYLLFIVLKAAGRPFQSFFLLKRD